MKDSRTAAGGKPKPAKKILPIKSGTTFKKDNLVMNTQKLKSMKATPVKNSLASKPADWKKKNFNMAINVPESAIQKLRDGKTKSNNIKTYGATKSAVMKEAMNRFYGKGWNGPAAGSKNKPGSYPNLPPAPNGKGEWLFNSKTGKWEPLKRPSARKTGRGN